MTGRWKISIVVMMALFGLAVAAVDAEGATLKGYVTDAVSEEGIGEAWIHAWNSTTEEENSTTSEYGNGYYEINLSMGEYDLEAQHSSHETYEGDVTIDETVEWYNFTMEPFARVMGYVTDNASEDPINGVNLEFEGEGDRYYAYTNASGYYEGHVPKGSHEVHAMEPNHLDRDFNVTIETYVFWYNFTMEPLNRVMGYVTDNDTEAGIPWVMLHFESLEVVLHRYTSTNETGYYSALVAPGQNAVWASHTNYSERGVNFSAGEEESWLNFTMEPLPEPDCLIKGYVTNGTGVAVEGVSVGVSQETGFSHWDGNTTDGEGHFTLWGYAGYYGYFSAMLEGYNENWTQAMLDGEVFWLNMTITRKVNITVRGYVTDESEEPVDGAYVQFSGPDWEWNHSDEEGYYELVVHATGKYSINAYRYDQDFYGFGSFPEEGAYWYNITLHEMHSGNGTKYNVSGWVYDWDTEDPIEGASVNAWSDMDSNFTTTDATGWFHMTIWAVDWIDVMASASGYADLYEDFAAADIEETFWLESATTYWVKGHVYDDDTDKPIKGAIVEADSDADYNWTETNSTGWFYMEIEAGSWIGVEVSAEGYLDETDYFDAGNIEEDFHLDTVPYNGTVAGHVSDENGTALEGIMVVFMSMFDGGDGGQIYNATDADGYFELEGPAMLVALVAMDMNGTYLPYVHALAMIENDTVWHNITLYANRSSDSLVQGSVGDSAGDAVNDAEVSLYPTIPGAMMLQYRTFTDGDGNYEMAVPNGSYIAVVSAYDIEEWYIEYLEVDGDTWYNVSLVAVVNETSMEVHFETWEEGTAKMVQKMSGMSDMFSRLFIDMVFGDSDGTVSEEEHESYMDAFSDEFDMDPEFDDEDSRDDYTVDGLGYFMEFASAHVYAKGDVVSFSAIEMKMVMELELNGTIVEADTHEIAMNITGDDEDSPFTDFTFYIPTGYWLQNHTAPDGVSVTGVSVLEIVANETAEGWLYMTVTNEGAPDPVELDDPENIEGTSMDLSWSEFDGTDFDKYTVYKSTKASSIGHSIADVTDVATNEYAVTGLSPGTTYYFVVRTYIGTGTYADSNQVTGRTPTTSSPGFGVSVSLSYTPEKPKEGKTVTVTAVITNEMDDGVSLTVRFLVDGDEEGSEALNLTSGASDTLTFKWKAKKGTHNLTVRAETGTDWSLDSEDVSVKKESSSTPGFEGLLVAGAILAAVVVVRRRR